MLFNLTENKKKFQNISSRTILSHFTLEIKNTSDLITLREISEQSILYVIRQRYKLDQIYTSVGNSLVISINPYRDIKLYEKSFEEIYRIPPKQEVFSIIFK